MENVKIISDSGVEQNVKGLFYIFNSKYYFIYTAAELDENEYVKLYVVQVCKEVQNTPTGPVDTGYMLGMEISDSEEWGKVQESITKIVEDRKNNTQSTEIQYLPISMLVNLKIVNKNKFKLMKHIVEDDFKVTISSYDTSNSNNITANSLENNIQDFTIQPVQPIVNSDITLTNDMSDISDVSDMGNTGEVIIDYRSRFFEEQQKNQALEEQIKILNEKLDNIKNIIG